MDDQAEEVQTAPAAAGKGRLLPMIGIAVVSLLLGGGGTWFFVSRSGGDAATPEAAEVAKASEHGDEADGTKAAVAGGSDAVAPGAGQSPLTERLITLDPFVVNLDESGAKRFLRTKIELETGSPAEKAEIQARSAQLRDSIVVLLTSKRLEDLGGFEGKVILKDEIERRLNDMLGGDPIRSVLITEFVIQ